MFISDDKSEFRQDSGHVRFGIDNAGNPIYHPFDDLLPDPVDLQSDMYMYSAGSINYSIISNPSTGDVTVEVVDPATNATLQKLSVSTDAKIDASDFIPNQPYAIVSTTKEGAIEIKTIMVNETELFIAD